MSSAGPRPHRLASWPPWISHWLGYRATPPKPLPKYLVWFWTYISAFGGLSLLQGLFNYSHFFIGRGVPGIVASYAASAALIFGTIEAPLAQPRALVGGHFISALVGVCITKLFETMHDKVRLEQVRWLAGSLSAATALLLMQITETIHPPAGATALLAAVNQPIYELGWYYLPVILLSSVLMLVVALIVNNIQRRYPVFWFTPNPPPKPVSPPAPALTPALFDEKKNVPGAKLSPPSISASSSIGSTSKMTTVVDISETTGEEGEEGNPTEESIFKGVPTTTDPANLV